MMITLRDFERTDEALLIEYLNNPNITRYLTSRIPQLIRQMMQGGGLIRAAKLVGIKRLLLTVYLSVLSALCLESLSIPSQAQWAIGSRNRIGERGLLQMF
jgi:hypothetical protein